MDKRDCMIRKRNRCYKLKKKSGNKADKKVQKVKTGNTETATESILAVNRKHCYTRTR